MMSSSPSICREIKEDTTNPPNLSPSVHTLHDPYLFESYFLSIFDEDSLSLTIEGEDSFPTKQEHSTISSPLILDDTRDENEESFCQFPELTKDLWLKSLREISKILIKWEPIVINTTCFIFESNCRYTIKESALPYFKMFPWFHAPVRFRQVIKDPQVLQALISSINFFFSRIYTQSDIEIFLSYYETMKISLKRSQCLSQILQVHHDLHPLLTTPSLSLKNQILTPDCTRNVRLLEFQKKNEGMSREEWNRAIPVALHFLQQNSTISPLKRDHFLRNEKSRYSISAVAIKFLRIFPWFHSLRRFRFVLEDGEEIIDHAILAANFFLRKSGKDYTADEIQSLQKCYQAMEIPSPQKCLHAILDVYESFILKTNTPPDRNIVSRIRREITNLKLFANPGDDKDFSSQNLQELRCRIEKNSILLENLANRVANIEKIMDDECTMNKRARRGGDRACWYPIRPDDYSARNSWCVPGAVLGLYSDGVGPLVPLHVRVRHSVLVYSVDPDIIEEHPNPQKCDRYVRCVMIGEAPVKLRADQYELLRENSLYDIYVNKYGDVCLSQLNQIPDPSTCTIFATTFWSKDLPVDAEGYPTFQGVRGVCAKIFSSSPLMNPHSSSRNAFWTETALVMKNLFLKTSIPGTGSLSLSELLLLRQEKYSQLAALDRKSSSRENFTEPTRQLSLTEITGLARGGESEKTILQKKFQSLLEGAKKTLSIVMTRQKSTSLSPVSCQSSTPSSLKELESEEGDEKISKGRLRKEIKELSRILRSYPPVLPEY